MVQKTKTEMRRRTCTWRNIVVVLSVYECSRCRIKLKIAKPTQSFAVRAKFPNPLLQLTFRSIDSVVECKSIFGLPLLYFRCTAQGFFIWNKRESSSFINVDRRHQYNLADPADRSWGRRNKSSKDTSRLKKMERKQGD